MKALLPYIFVIGALAILISVWAIGAYFAQRRRQALEQLAESLGFSFIAAAGATTLATLPRLTLLQAGHTQQIRNLMMGSTDTTQVMIFDWHYITGSGKSSQNHLVTVVAIQSSELRLPLWLCRPASVLDWFGLAFDGRDINFEDQPVFSKKYHLHGNNEARLRRLFDADVCSFFEQHPNSYAEATGPWLIYCVQEKKISPERVHDLLQAAFQLHVLLKGEPGDESPAEGSQPAVSDQPRDEMSSEAERQF